MSTNGGVSAAWTVQSAPPFDGMFLHEALAAHYERYEVEGNPVAWKAVTTHVAVLGPASNRRNIVDSYPDVPSAETDSVYYATSIELSVSDRRPYLKAALKEWRRVAKHYPGATAIAAGMVRQLKAAAGLLGDPVPDGDPVPQSTEPLTLAKLMQPEFHPPAWYPHAAWPRSGLPAGLSGQAVVRVVLDDAGVVRDVSLISSTAPMFEQPAVLAATISRFAPGTNSPILVTYYFPPSDPTSTLAQ